MEALKNELKKTMVVWRDALIWEKRFANLKKLFLVILGVAVFIIIFPMPTRCRIENHGAYRPANDLVIGAYVVRDCYPPNRAEFWQNPQLSFEFRWLFVPTLDSITGHRGVSVINIHL